MKKRYSCFVMALVLMFSLCISFVTTIHAASVHTVSSAQELFDLANRVNSGENFSNVKVVLAADIDLNDAVINQEDGSLLEGDLLSGLQSVQMSIPLPAPLTERAILFPVCISMTLRPNLLACLA